MVRTIGIGVDFYLDQVLQLGDKNSGGYTMALVRKSEAVRKLYEARELMRDTFEGRLYNLMAAADTENFRRICHGFPVEGRVFKEFQAAESPEVFYKKHGLLVKS